MTVLPSSAQAFLEALGTEFTFQTFDDREQKRQHLSRVLHGTFAQHAGTLAALNRQGAGVFVMVNVGDGKGRKAANVQAVRAYFADLDSAPLDAVYAFALRPHFVLESSAGRWHAYWFVDDAPLDAFKATQQAIAERLGSDPKVCDLPRVMRLPGFIHCKGRPFASRIIERYDGPRYSHAQMCEALGVTLQVTPEVTPEVTRPALLPEQIPEGGRNDALFRAAVGLVRAGHTPADVNQRLQRINAERCLPPLCATEVDAIAANASEYGSQGFIKFPHELFDSLEWKGLPPAAQAVILLAFRRYNGSNNGNIALPWSEFEGRPGFASKATFYAQRSKAMRSGILRQVSDGRNAKAGRKPDLFAIEQRWLRDSPVLKSVPGPSTKKVHPYIDKQGERREERELHAGNLVLVGGKR